MIWKLLSVIAELEQRRHELFLHLTGCRDHGCFQIWIAVHGFENRPDLRIAGLLAGKRRGIVQYSRKLVEEFFWNDPLCLFLSGRCRRHLWNFAPVDAFHRAVIFGQGVHKHLSKYSLDRLFVFGRIVLEYARTNKSGVGRGAKHCRNPLWHLAFPVRPDQQIESGRGAVHLSKLNEMVGAEIYSLIDPEAIAEVRHLDHHR